MATRRGTSARWIAVVGLCLWAGIWWQTDLTRWKGGRLPEASGHAGTFLRALWSQQVGQVDAAAIDPSAGTIATVSPGGVLRVLDAAGQKSAEATLPGTDSLALAGAGKVIAAFARANPARTTITFLRPDGSELWHRDVGDPILDATVSQSGERAACVTADGSIYSFDLEGHPSYRHWRSTGTPRQVYLDPEGSVLLVATADPPTAWAYSPSGEFAWKAPNNDPTGTAQLFASADGRFLACATSPGQTGASAYVSRFMVMSSRGRQQWGARLRASSPQIALAGDGQYAAVTYARKVPGRAQATYERKAVLLKTSSTGGTVPDELWQHGGPFYDPRLVCIAADGAFVATRDGQRSIFFFGPTGQLLWRHKMPSPIVRTAASADGLSILVYCLDGSLSLFRVADDRG